MLDKAGVYRDTHWRDPSIMFAWDEKSNYWAYIDPTVYKKSSIIKFKPAYNDCNVGRTSKVGQQVLERTTIINIKEDKMSRDVNYIGGEYKVVEVNYQGSNINYYLKIDVDVEVKVGDLVCTESSQGLVIATVKTVLDNSIGNAPFVQRAKAWVVCVIDYSRQQARKEATEKRDYILKQLEEKRQQMEVVNMYALLAKMDPEAERLLTELKSLGN